MTNKEQPKQPEFSPEQLRAAQLKLHDLQGKLLKGEPLSDDERQVVETFLKVETSSSETPKTSVLEETAFPDEVSSAEAAPAETKSVAAEMGEAVKGVAGEEAVGEQGAPEEAEAAAMTEEKIDSL